MQWLLVLTPGRPDLLTSGPTEAEIAAVGRHFAYWQGLVEAGVALVVGRTQTTGPDTLGLAIFRAETEAEAQEIAKIDPGIVAGVFHFRVMPYQVALLGDPSPFRP